MRLAAYSLSACDSAQLRSAALGRVLVLMSALSQVVTSVAMLPRRLAATLMNESFGVSDSIATFNDENRRRSIKQRHDFMI